MNFLPVDFASPLQLISPHFSLDLPAKWQQPLQNSAQSLILGVRPQHLFIDPESPSSIQIEVDLVEALGNETYISAHLTAQPDLIITVSLPPDRTVRVGDRLWLGMNTNKIHLFTVDDGRAIAV